jgi:hypothetical protein
VNEDSNAVGFELGFSFSPGGLLLPYHLGVMSTLVDSGHVTARTPLAGSSAGAIAVAAFAAGVPIEATFEVREAVKRLAIDLFVYVFDSLVKRVLGCLCASWFFFGGLAATAQGCLRVAARCRAKGGARGRLLDELCAELDLLLPDDAHDALARRPAPAILAYRQVRTSFRCLVVYPPSRPGGTDARSERASASFGGVKKWRSSLTGVSAREHHGVFVCVQRRPQGGAASLVHGAVLLDAVAGVFVPRPASCGRLFYAARRPLRVPRAALKRGAHRHRVGTNPTAAHVWSRYV